MIHFPMGSEHAVLSHHYEDGIGRHITYTMHSAPTARYSQKDKEGLTSTSKSSIIMPYYSKACLLLFRWSPASYSHFSRIDILYATWWMISHQTVMLADSKYRATYSHHRCIWSLKLHWWMLPYMAMSHPCHQYYLKLFFYINYKLLKSIWLVIIMSLFHVLYEVL